MGTKKLTPKEETETVIENTADQAGAVATQDENLPVQSSEGFGPGVSGEFNADDLQHPVLSLVQNTGDLGDEFKKGTWVFNKEAQLTTTYDGDDKPGDNPKPRVRAICLSLNKYWRQNKDYNAPGFALEWETEAQAEETPIQDAAGNPLLINGEPQYYVKGNSGRNTFAEAAKMVWMLEVPEDQSEFEYTAEDGTVIYFARAIYRATSTAWQVAKTVFTASVSRKGKDPETGAARPHVWMWELSSRKIVNPKNTYWKPVAHNKGLMDNHLMAWVNDEVLSLM